ncbi:hypothetical protein TUMSATVNIG3_26140 [Vibrio nigripulchritudo]|nr:hypothetical protein TUMSATVNIG2_25620 [Vibrio nigripulchritudo]BDU43816.1 hypothetical protein TUMSATVNIG3_26140 [Vibrio nigripulchritudo]
MREPFPLSVLSITAQFLFSLGKNQPKEEKINLKSTNQILITKTNNKVRIMLKIIGRKPIKTALFIMSTFILEN